MPLISSARTVVLILVGLGLLRAHPSYAITICLKTRATVSSPIIRLGDIADVEHGPLGEIEQYRQVKIAPAPAANGRLYLQYATIRHRLQAMGLNPSQVDFTGQSVVIVESQTLQLESSLSQSKRSRNRPPSSSEPTPWQIRQAERLVTDAIRDSLKLQLPQEAIDLARIQVDVHPEDVPRLIRLNQTMPHVSGWSGTLEQAQNLVLTTQDQQPDIKPVVVSCQITMAPKVLAVRHSIAIGSIIQAGDLDWIYSDSAEGIQQPQQVIGQEAVRALRPGIALSSQDIRGKPYVRSQDIVSVYVRLRGIAVNRPMRALADGGLGETIPLTTLDRREKVVARVTGYHEAEILDASNLDVARSEIP